MQIHTVYQGNAVSLSLFPSSISWERGYTGWPGLVVNFYGQIVSHLNNKGWHAYLHVRSGHPVNTKAPTREGLIEDGKLSAFYTWAENALFEWVCSQPSPPVEYVERLYELNRERASRECPFAVVRLWEPLPTEYVFESYSDYVGLDRFYENSDQESAQLGPKQLVRKEEMSAKLFLADYVVCLLPSNHPAQSWIDQEIIASGQVGEEDEPSMSFEIGLTSLLRATNLTAYKAICGVPPEMVKRLCWRPGPMADGYYTLAPGLWGIQAEPTPEEKWDLFQEIEWHPLSVDAGPIFVVDTHDHYDLTNRYWIIALGSKDEIVPFLQQTGHAAFVLDEDDEEQSIESYAASVDALIRTYLGNHIARSTTLADLASDVQPFLPDGYEAQEATLKLIYKEHCLTSLRLEFADGFTKEVQFY